MYPTGYSVLQSTRIETRFPLHLANAAKACACPRGGTRIETIIAVITSVITAGNAVHKGGVLRFLPFLPFLATARTAFTQ